MRLLAALIASFVFTSTAFATNDCFYRRTANSFTVSGPDTLQIRDGGRVYQVRTEFCPRLRWADRIGFDSYSSWICRGDSILLFDWSGRYEDRCWILDIKRIR